MSEPKDKNEKGKAKRSAKPKRPADATPAKPSAETPSKDPKSVLVNDEIPLGPRMEGGEDAAGEETSQTVICIVTPDAEQERKLRDELRDCRERLNAARDFYRSLITRWKMMDSYNAFEACRRVRRAFRNGVLVGSISTAAALAVATGILLLLK